jgi:hypothetical protein
VPLREPPRKPPQNRLGVPWCGSGALCDGCQSVKSLIADGANLGVSTRALGSLKPLNGDANEVKDDLRLIAIDVVTDPSAPDAWVQVSNENAEWVYNPGTGLYEQAKIEVLAKAIKRMPTRQVDEVRLTCSDVG